jgi:hypothetical protein
VVACTGPVVTVTAPGSNIVGEFTLPRICRGLLCGTRWSLRTQESEIPELPTPQPEVDSFGYRVGDALSDEDLNSNLRVALPLSIFSMGRLVGIEPTTS